MLLYKHVRLPFHGPLSCARSERADDLAEVCQASKRRKATHVAGTEREKPLFSFLATRMDVLVAEFPSWEAALLSCYNLR